MGAQETILWLLTWLCSVPQHSHDEGPAVWKLAPRPGCEDAAVRGASCDADMPHLCLLAPHPSIISLGEGVKGKRSEHALCAHTCLRIRQRVAGSLISGEGERGLLSAVPPSVGPGEASHSALQGTGSGCMSGQPSHPCSAFKFKSLWRIEATE